MVKGVPSQFGKFLRKLRIDFEERQGDMANVLGVTKAYLSAVELGKRSVPKEWRGMLIDKYTLDVNKTKEMDDALVEDMKVINIDASNLSLEDRILVETLGKRMTELSEEAKQKIKSILR